MDSFETKCGHIVRISSVQQVGGPKEGKWRLRVSGPSISLQCGFKCLYSEPNLSSVNDTVAAYLEVDVADLRKPPTRPRILLGLDVETSDWDEQCSFTRQDEHLEAGFPCAINHRAVTGHICAVGCTVFRRSASMPQLYSVEEMISSVIKLPEGETISKQAIDIHGISDHACQQGESLGRVFRFIVAWLKQGAEICCHNIAHECFVWCREIQKRIPTDPLMFAQEDTSLFLRSLYQGHCTLRLGKQRNGFFRTLTQEFSSCCRDEAHLDKRHDAAQDAYKCARLFLHYNQAFVAIPKDDKADTRDTKKAKVVVFHEVDT